MYSVLVLLDDSLSQQAINDWRDIASSFATFQGSPVALGVASAEALADVDAFLDNSPRQWDFQPLDAAPAVAAPAPSTAPMSSAEFIYREDGRPDWGAMWTSFCELALYGGPPHRGEPDTLRAPIEVPAPDPASDAITEIRRGIFETTGLFAEPTNDGWVAVTCRSRKMAAWLCATIILENVEARFEDERLFLPASPDFRLKNEVKSVITVLAKTNHYWEAHIAATESANQPAAV